MDYSNKSFDRFQNAIEKGCGRDSLIWRLRDALFAEAFYGKQRRLDLLLRIPYGWIPHLACQFATAWLTSRAAKPALDSGPGAIHFLFLSARNNHTQRLMPLLSDAIQRGRPFASWFDVSGVREQAKDELKQHFTWIGGIWARHLKFTDFTEALLQTRMLAACLGTDLDRRKSRAILIYLVQFLAWRRFWSETFRKFKPTTIISTFEKAPRVKSFYHAAWEAGVSERIHWIHGLRHSSIQATLATELWCMTPGDVRFFKSRVPEFCTPSVRENPEAAELARTIGVIDANAIMPNQPIHFLFLGPGQEASYTRDMRMADLGVIKTLQVAFGPKIRWRFRPHPSAAERFRAELDESGITADDFSNRHLHDDLKWAHAVGSSWSSLLLDIRGTGRRIFWVQAEVRNLGAVDELIADGIGVHLDDASGTERLAGSFPALGHA